MARWLVLIVCGVFVLFALSGAACSWMIRATDKPLEHLERSRCIEHSGSGGIRERQCLDFTAPTMKVGEKFLREKKQHARKAVV